MGGGKPCLQRGSILRKGRIIVRIQTLLAHNPPEARNQVEVRRERGQIPQLDPQCHSVVLHQRALLIARVVEDDRDRTFRECAASLLNNWHTVSAVTVVSLTTVMISL